jgi:hypothetical protein
MKWERDRLGRTRRRLAEGSWRAGSRAQSKSSTGDVIRTSRAIHSARCCAGGDIAARCPCHGEELAGFAQAAAPRAGGELAMSLKGSRHRFALRLPPSAPD